MVSSSLMCFTFYISSLVVLHSSLHSSLFIRHLFFCLLHLVTRHSSLRHSSLLHSSLVTRRSSSRHLFITLRHSSFVILHSSRHSSLVTRHFVTSFITRHSSVTSHAPLESYKRARALAVGEIPCAVNTTTAS